MSNQYFKDETFTGLDYTTDNHDGSEYDNCVFKDCNFSGVDLSRASFTDCEFENCDWSNVKLRQATLNNVRFASCKMLGILFGDCNPFLLSFSFSNCNLSYSSFYKLKAHATNFTNCNLQEADFTTADLSGSVFDGCNLQGAMFDNTILENTDLRTAIGFSIDPENNRIYRAKFSIDGLQGLLYKYNIEVE